MPRYKCHKEVYALKIARISYENIATATIHPAEEGYAPFEVDADYLKRHKPVPGGYFVVYSDGYRSFSPSEAFESGYTRVS
jgi:hypothetical protein